MADVQDLYGHRAVRALVRLHGFPVGSVKVPRVGTTCPGERIRDEAVRQLGDTIIERLIATALESDAAQPIALDRRRSPDARSTRLPAAAEHVTVIVCTRNRARDLASCLDALAMLDPAPAEVLVIDNAPRDDSTRRVVEARRECRYVLESRPGLD